MILISACFCALLSTDCATRVSPALIGATSVSYRVRCSVIDMVSRNPIVDLKTDERAGLILQVYVSACQAKGVETPLATRFAVVFRSIGINPVSSDQTLMQKDVATF